ncbi:MAG: NUDIX hydrolase [Rhizobiales bacterium]|nr:NUDIX hydrolase [Hyphomicrobiales bacterium]
MNDLVERLTNTERDQSFANVRPRDAATLIVLDHSEGQPKVMMGRRHDRHKFMPGKFVFPGGRVEVYDGRMSAAGELPAAIERRLLTHVKRPTKAKARALALAALRETSEETGVVLGTRNAQTPKIPGEGWKPFADANVMPDLQSLYFIARAITPPRRPRRFDTRFFAIDAKTIAHRFDGTVGPDGEFDDLVWIPVSEARQLDLPTITQVVLEELEARIAAGLETDRPVPFYRMVRGRFTRELI